MCHEGEPCVAEWNSAVCIEEVRPVLGDDVGNAIEVVRAPRIRAFAAHGNWSQWRRIYHLLCKISGHFAVIVVKITILGIDTVVWDSGQGSSFVASMGGAEPTETVRKVFADAESHLMPPSGPGESPQDVPLRTARDRVPSWLEL